MSRTPAGLPAVAAFTLVVPMLATPAAAVDAPRLPVQPLLLLDPPETTAPWLVAGVSVAGSPEDSSYDLYGFEQEEAGTLDLSEEPVLAGDRGLVQPAFSPDGSQLVFSAQQPDSDEWHLMVGDVAATPHGPEVSQVRPLDYRTRADAADSQPAWSPDGRYIAFVREYGPEGDRAQDGPQVQVLDRQHPDRLDEVTLPEDPVGMGTDHRWTATPTWSPDGSGLLVTGSIGESTSTAFAPLDPDAAGTGSLWYYELENGTVHQLTETDPGCTQEPCTVAIGAVTTAWSPTDPAAVAFAPWWGGGVSLLSLPETLPRGGTADVALTEDVVELVDGAEPPEYQDLVWTPDGSALYAAQDGYPQVTRIDTAGGSDVVYEDTQTYPWLLGLAHQPASDLGITLQAPTSPVTGEPFPVTAEVTNAGPSPARGSQVLLQVPAGATVDGLPAGCTGPVEQVVTCRLDPLAVEDATTVTVDLTIGSPSVGTVSATVSSESPEPRTATASNLTAAVLAATAPAEGRSRQISFTLERVHWVGGQVRGSPDLVQSLLPSAGSDPASTYRVLVDETYDQLDPPEQDPVSGTFLVDEDQLDYSPDGSRVTYVRTGQDNDYDDGERSGRSELVVADVVGTQSTDAEPGTFVDATVIDTGPGVAEGFTVQDPVWSPDGTRIAFVRADDTVAGGSSLHVVDLSATPPQVLDPLEDSWVPDTSQPGYLVSDPTWAPDGTGLVFSAFGDLSAPSLWYAPLAEAPAVPHPLVLPADGGQCWPQGDSTGEPPVCTGPLVGESPAWSPTGGTLAFTDTYYSGYDALYLATLPDDLPGIVADLAEGAAVPIGTLRPVDPFGFGTDPVPSLIDPTWSPDGASIAASAGYRRYDGQVDTPESVLQVDPQVPATATTLFSAGMDAAAPEGVDPWIDNPEYVPYSDVAITADAGPTVLPGARTDVTLTVANYGPSPARDAIVTLPLPSGLTVGTLPAGCRSASATLTCELRDGLAAGSEQVLTVPVTAADADQYDLTATVVTNSVDPHAGNDLNATTLLVAAGGSERIAFSMQRPGEPGGEAVNATSLDLVRSLTTVTGEASGTDYTVLAGTVLADVTNIEALGENLGPLLADDDNIDYSADGGRAVFNRTAATQYPYLLDAAEPADQRLVLADVVGTQQTERGDPGELVRLTEVDDSPGALSTDPDQADRVSDTEPVFSPGGDQVAFVRMVTANDGRAPGQLMLLDADSQQMTSPFDPGWLAETGTGLDMTSPTWSPDGDALLFAAQGGRDDVPTLWYLPLSTGLPHPLTLPTGGSVCWPGSGGDLCTGPVTGWAPAWAPEGRQVAFTYYASDGPAIAVLTVDQTTTGTALGADTSTPAPIAALAGVAAFLPEGPTAAPVDSPAWSPDGARIAVAQGGSDYPNQIVAAPLDGAPATLFAVPEVGTELAHPQFQPYSDLAVTIAEPAGPISTGTSTPVTVTVTNRGPSPARDAFLTLTLPVGAGTGALPEVCTADGRTVTCVLSDPIAVDADVELTVPVTFTAGEHEVGAAVVTNSIDTEVGNDTATRTVTATSPSTPSDPAAPTINAPDLQVRLTLDADRAWLGGDGLLAHLTVTNGGGAPAPGVQLTTTLPEGVLVLDAGDCPVAGACELGALASGDQVSVDLLLQPTAVGRVQVTASASTTATDPVVGNNTDTASFEGVQAQLRLLPAVAEPGEVTLLYGVDLPPDAQITLRWSEGITAVYRPVAAAEDGTLRTPVLIVDGDELGRRTLEVTSVAGTAFGLESAPALLVVPQSMAPPDFLGRS